MRFKTEYTINFRIIQLLRAGGKMNSKQAEVKAPSALKFV
ncbi:hypothetical protein TPE_1112 [Treponema pedis str. T A4]|uniref:Uncharacterized protein n=1 Tax=Treponema pedis str. T A4 TaxID=1291379 RepID=S5ZZD8_9SPIR|nr:hypothetical protein TPE_1112 [Treponema pedis str. T A4]